jgi:hypothetical protein
VNLVVCESCEAEFVIKHNMDNYHYKTLYCPFCKGDIDDPNYIDEMPDWNEDDF